MSRQNCLYVDVMAIDNIIAAIDRAEEQLFSAIDTAMAHNVSSSRGLDEQPAPAAVSQQAVEPVERMNAYDQLAARVESEASRKKPSVALAAGAKKSPVATPVEREAQRKRPGVRPVDARHVIDVDGDDVVHVKDIENDVDVFAAGPASGRKEWKPTAAPAKSSLSKRNVVKVDLVAEPHKTAPSKGARADHAQPQAKPDEERPKAESMPAQGLAVGTPLSTPTLPSVSTSPHPRDHAPRVPTGRSAGLGATLNGASRIPSRVPTSSASIATAASSAQSAALPPAAPGVVYIPGVCAIGRTLPNGFRETPQGLRPVVTLAQRPKVPLTMRQTLADKLFAALKARNISDMDAVVDSALTEQRMYASAKDRIEYRSKSMMELARVKRETDVAKATQSAMEIASADQETAPDGGPGAASTSAVGPGDGNTAN